MAIAGVILMAGPQIGTVPAAMMALTQGPVTAFIVLIGFLDCRGVTYET